MNNLISICIFLGLGAAFVLLNLTLGKLGRPRLPNAEKSQSYECGEEPIGTSWIQFDLRFYIIALVFLVFDVEIALFYPWAVVYMNNKGPALIDMLVFFAVLLVGYVYLWRFGYLEWVRSAVTTSMQRNPASADRAALSEKARKDPEMVEV